MDFCLCKPSITVDTEEPWTGGLTTGVGQSPTQDPKSGQGRQRCEIYFAPTYVGRVVAPYDLLLCLTLQVLDLTVLDWT